MTRQDKLIRQSRKMPFMIRGLEGSSAFMVKIQSKNELFRFFRLVLPDLNSLAIIPQSMCQNQETMPAFCFSCKENLARVALWDVMAGGMRTQNLFAAYPMIPTKRELYPGIV